MEQILAWITATAMNMGFSAPGMFVCLVIAILSGTVGSVPMVLLTWVIYALSATAFGSWLLDRTSEPAV